MYKESRKILIEPVFSKSYYLQANIKALPDISKGISPNTSATNKMINADNINRNVLRNLISVDPTSGDWSKSVKDHYSSILYFISSGGKVLETGFIYNSEEDAKSFADKTEKIIKKYKPLLEKAENDKEELSIFNLQKDELFQLEEEKNTLVEGRPKYGVPIHAEEYIVYLYCLYTSYVAKRLKDVDKPASLKYIMTSEEETIKAEEEAFKLQFNADEAYIKVASDESKLDYVLKVFNVYTPNLTTTDKRKLAKKQVIASPAKFLAVVNDKNLEKKAFIEDLVRANIITKLKDSGVYVDSTDTSIIIGSNIKEVMVFFNEENTVTKAKASELIAKFKSLKASK